MKGEVEAIGHLARIARVQGTHPSPVLCYDYESCNFNIVNNTSHLTPVNIDQINILDECAVLCVLCLPHSDSLIQN